ncbi:MAG TPA: c-type cytochrome domain-containing protein, partial [Verrucomicrobiae bacterium]
MHERLALPPARQGCIKLSLLSTRGTSGERTVHPPQCCYGGREERGNQHKPASSPQPSPPSDGGEGEIEELDAALQARRRSRGLRLLGALGLLMLVLPVPAANDPPTKSPPPAARLTFEEHIRPIFKANCFDCHGEGEKLKGELDLRLRRLTLKGGESGPAIVP